MIKASTFIKSSDSIKSCPPANKPEFAFIGRSNVGKSSMINMLTNRHKLAKISSTPGKTQTINHFLINDHWYLVDLPGYGWAKLGKEQKYKMEEMIREYLLKRENLTMVLVLVDIRHKPQELDVEFINWLGENGIPFIIVFTKSDKVSKAARVKSIENYRETLTQYWDEIPVMLKSSSKTKQGQKEILDYIGDVIKKTEF